MSIVRFTLRDNDSINVFGSEKVANWADLESTLTRSATYLGRVRKLTTSFQFVKEIRTLLIKNKDTYGINALVYLKIEIGNNNADEASFSAIGAGYEMVGDFSEKGFLITETTADLRFYDSSFQEKLQNGEKEKININVSSDLTGGSVSNYEDILKDCTMHDRELVYNSQLNFIEQEYAIDSQRAFISDSIAFQVPYLAITRPEGSGVVDGNEIVLINGTPAELTATTSFLFNSPKSAITDVEFATKFNISGSFLTLGAFEATLIIKALYIWVDSDYVEKERVELYSQSVDQAETGANWDVFFDIELQRSGLNIIEGDSLILQVEIFVHTVGLTPVKLSNITVTPNSEDYKLRVSSITTFEKTVSKIILPHEFFTFWIELLTGEKNAFYSEFFGRTDILNESGAPKYAQDGEGAYLSLCDGHMIRNLPLTENPFNTSFMDAFKAYHYIFCLSGQTEFIGNTEVFRIEKWKDAVSQDTVLDLGELVAEWEASINDDLTFSSINIGYKPRKLEDLNGLTIYNEEINYKTPLNNTDNTLELVTDYIAADYIIEQQRRLQFELYPDTDGRNDKGIFLISVIKNDVGDLNSRTTEGFNVASITGILAPTKAYNLDITPARMFENWGSYVNACLIKENNRTLVLTKSASNNQLSSQLLTETTPVNEGDDVLISTLDNPLYENEKYIIGDAPLTKAMYDAFEANTQGIVAFKVKGIEYFGRGDIVSYKSNGSKGSFTLTKARR